MRSWKSVVLSAFVVGTLAPAAAFAAPSKDLMPYWQTHNDASTATIDYGAWGQFLKAHVQPSADGINRVSYATVTAAEKQAMDADVRRLAAVKVTGYSRREQFAYWVNLYNELTVLTVLTHYPVKSIRDIDISPGLFTSGPWDKQLVQVEGKELTLNDIEHRILRPIWNDPRIHYAVNCASLGCPNLMQEPYTAGNEEQMLNKGAHDYVNSRRGANITAGKLTASSIYDWYQADFGGNDAGVIAHMRKYADAPFTQALQPVTAVSGYDYNWSLNNATAR